MPFHVAKEQYIQSPHEYLPKAFNHPTVEHHDPPKGKESYLLPAVLDVQNGAEMTATYPGPCIYYVTEGEIEYEDRKNPGNTTVLREGGILHVEEGSLIRWTCKSPNGVKGFAVAHVPVSITSVDDFVALEQ
ncbi:hypothetical protein JR316_0011226 [Psilocybe cubensis]|uniref:Uncharacterized protein n=2 Tax=Psilocybe cubensis TaxID=181762 RepID=A0ACB8GJU2_PSICU|nr:hypothetical protein JR316_0011226 [Psilocybe cubensis]KAH9475667.1 hypothetical protein JR316_0011226 [Psilocybe cubensis]